MFHTAPLPETHLRPAQAHRPAVVERARTEGLDVRPAHRQRRPAGHHRRAPARHRPARPVQRPAHRHRPAAAQSAVGEVEIGNCRRAVERDCDRERQNRLVGRSWNLAGVPVRGGIPVAAGAIDPGDIRCAQ